MAGTGPPPPRRGYGLNTFTWTDERTAYLRFHWNAGLLSSSQIAKLLGVTRNMVIGKARRLDLDHRLPSKPGRLTDHRKRRRAKAPQRILRPMQQERRIQPIAPPAPELPRGKPVALIDLEPQHCRWPIGEATEMLFCGAISNETSSYCEYHARKAFVTKNFSRNPNVGS